jgi:predicted nucleic acid-binding protein
MNPEGSFLLDTSALLALRGGETGADEVDNLLRSAAKGGCLLLASFMTRMEILYIIRRTEGEESARHAIRLIDTFKIKWISCDPEILYIAAQLKAEGGLSVADCWIGATAIACNATLIHRDPEFKKFPKIPQKYLAKGYTS